MTQSESNRQRATTRRGTTLAFWVLWTCLLTPDAVAQFPQRVLLARTQEDGSWRAAENRLLAEFRAAGLQVIVIDDRPPKDKRLPAQVEQLGAVAGAQAFRSRENGTVRLWLNAQAGSGAGFRHVRVQLRGADVLSHAVLPSVEVVIAQAQSNRSTRRPTPSLDELSLLNNSTVDASTPRQSRANTELALRFGFGPWFSGDGSSPAINTALSAQWRLHPTLFVVPELWGHPVAHQVDTALGVVDIRMAGARTHLMLEPWSEQPVSAGLGAGLGMVYARSSLDGGNPDTALAPVLSVRGQFSTEVTREVDAVLMLTASWATPALEVRRSDAESAARLVAPSIDATLALDWLWQ